MVLPENLQRSARKQQTQQPKIAELVKTILQPKLFVHKSIIAAGFVGMLAIVAMAPAVAYGATSQQKSADKHHNSKTPAKIKRTVHAEKKRHVSKAAERKIPANKKHVNNAAATTASHTASRKTSASNKRKSSPQQAKKSHIQQVNTRKTTKKHTVNSSRSTKTPRLHTVAPQSREHAYFDASPVIYFNNSSRPGKASISRQVERVSVAKKTAMTKLMRQLGKPYHWGGNSPGTGFDCSGLVYFAYKDLVNFPMPRTADAMYHLRDAAPVPRDQLKKGDLVFFHTENRALADHVGVYIGDNKFIQSPRTGKDVQITSMNDSYWQQHYIGARRIVTAKTVVR